MSNLTKLPLAMKRKIDYINSVSAKIKQLENLVYTYDGGTFPFCIDINSIDITKNFVYIWKGENDTYLTSLPHINYVRFKIDKSNNMFANEDLKHTINLIAKEYKKALKNL